jgi:hypothetical protein
MSRIVFVLLILALPVCIRAQDHYDPSKALSSEDLFLKQNDSKRVFTRPGERYLALDHTSWLGGFPPLPIFSG